MTDIKKSILVRDTRSKYKDIIKSIYDSNKKNDNDKPESDYKTNLLSSEQCEVKTATGKFPKIDKI